MSRLLTFSVVLLSLLTINNAQTQLNTPLPPLSAPIANPIDSITSLVSRYYPNHIQYFNFTVIPAEQGKNVYTLYSDNNLIYIQGNNLIALASGFNYYLKQYCQVSILWWSQSSKVPTLPTPLPTVPHPVTTVSPVKYSYYQNVCTVSYSSVWWTWSRWEKELDWMALQGINLSLAFTGQEIVWKQLYLQLGLTNDEINDWLAGPAFLAWQRMGNMQKFAGPLPQYWIEQQSQLQIQILQRMSEYGITRKFWSKTRPDFS